MTAFQCRRKKKYAIRRYNPFVVAKVPMRGVPGPDERTAAFRELAAYIFGGNQTDTKLQMATPVFSASESMEFVLHVESIEDAPPPQPGSKVHLKQVCLNVHPTEVFKRALYTLASRISCYPCACDNMSLPLPTFGPVAIMACGLLFIASTQLRACSDKKNPFRKEKNFMLR